MSREWFRRAFACTFNFCYLLFYSCVANQWATNCCIYVQQLVCYRIFVWSSQLILWPLLCPLRFVINERNKCVTSSLSQWRSSLSDDHKFLTHQLPPCLHCRLLDEIRTSSSDASYSMYCAFMTIWCLGSWVPRVRSGCLHRADFSRFSCVCFGHLFCIFPLGSFLLHFFLVQFSS